ncbi:murein hydrolase activator EnvC [Bombella sp. ESL0385]|uniref:murein hydrolase activator EnvC family protein n=1 Tax=Bombella sp. ESL0385 TaxID=2676446 RepID=UPI0012D9BC03|nr:peptidoglycan DD-metalloendopeptidase family protein [Bombella sp. ESL0385]MCT6855439.1 peptidoglycan DD-metalloendopeptidase family protein [Bombella apis]MUG90563.1 peptidoglycan DD-metalloendopeptidase family protein [Bombella sp. ESL0385]
MLLKYISRFWLVGFAAIIMCCPFHAAASKAVRASTSAIQTKRQALQQLLARKARLLQQEEDNTRKAETQAHLTARQLAQLRQKQALLAHQHARVEARLAALSQQLAQLTSGETHIQAQEHAILADEATRLPALRQLDTTPELALLMPTDGPADNPALPFALLTLRQQQNQEAMTHALQQEAQLHDQQKTLTTQSRTMAVQEGRLQTRQTLAENRTQHAEKLSEQAQQALLRQQALLTQARQSTEALTAIITKLAQQEANTRRRLKAEKQHFHKLHQHHEEQMVDEQTRTLSNPGKGLQHGAAHAPVQGRIVTQWAQPTEAGPATGLTYQTAPSAPVIAPCTGQMLFTGAFRSFGPMVILDCGQKQRLVLAGLGTIALHTGQAVQQGALIGHMPTQHPLLFVQLRHGTKLINPAAFF